MTVTARLNTAVDTRDAASKMWNAEERKGKFVGLLLRMRHPRATVLLYPTGRMVCLGCKSYLDSTDAFNRIARRLNALYDKNYVVSHIEIRNIVASVRFSPIDIHRMCSCERVCSSELFPGVSVRFDRASATLFASGCVHLTGVSDFVELSELYHRVVNFVGAYI